MAIGTPLQMELVFCPWEGFPLDDCYWNEIMKYFPGGWCSAEIRGLYGTRLWKEIREE